jgi:hypothetical protein
MSTKYPGGIIVANPTAPTTTSASGIWTLEQQEQAQQAGIWPFGGPFNYIEDVFSTYLYTGNGGPQTITNGIDLSTKGGLVWIKNRATGATGHQLIDTARTGSKVLASNNTNPQDNTGLTFNNNGFTLASGWSTDQNGESYVSWSFRKQPKFFDVVTFTGNGVDGRSISHNLTSRPGVVIIKRTDDTGGWKYKDYDTGSTLLLNSTDAANTTAALTGGYPSGFTSTTFSVVAYSSSLSAVNQSGATYVAYIFAHNAGGFGLTGTDNVISCGSFTTDGSGNATVSLGYEPQWLMVKASTYAQSWYIEDNMRAFNLTSRAILFPNLSNAEATGATAYLAPNSTGFAAVNGQLNASTTYIYIAIRRGPMAVPTVGTSVFSPNAVNVSAGTAITTGFPVDWQINYYRGFPANYNSINYSRLTGVSSNSTNSGQCLWTAKTDGEATFAGTLNWNNTGFQQTPNLWPNIDNIYWNLQRAPQFFDEVIINSSTNTYTHNLTIAPELIFVKCRSAAGANWVVYSKSLTSPTTKYLNLNTTGAEQLYGAGAWATSSTQFTVDSGLWANGASGVAYLFGTCSGVSKVGSYTGTGATQTIACGFTGGARFVLVKRIDSTGDWYVWDTARGMVSGTDPSLLLNSTAAEVNANSIYTATTGFQIVSTAAGINASGGSFIFLAIA